MDDAKKNDAEDNVKDCLAEGLRHWLLRYDAGFQPAKVNLA
jgi:hypothetical protein